MLPSEAVRVSLFVGSVLAVYFSASVSLIKSARRRLLAQAITLASREILFRRIIFVLAGLGLACIAYGYFLEPYWLEVTRVRIESPSLLKGTGPIRVAYITDVHSDPHPRLEERLAAVIAAEQPDLIAFTGDSINSSDALPVFKKCLRGLAAVAPVFAVRGNWDTDRWRDLDLFGGTGARELNGEVVRMTVRGARLSLVGLPWGSEHRVGAVIDKLRPDDFSIFLYHSPDQVFEVARRRVNLYLAGHTHGGQVALPFYGALTTGSKFDKRFEAGLYRVGQTWLYVNRGIGMEGGFAPRVRFCARPQVVIVEVWPPPS